MWTAIHTIDIVLWIIMASSVLYVTFYALVSLFPSRTSKLQPSAISPHPSLSFLILFPAYKEDAVIVHSVRQFLEQTYPKGLYEVVVISDHMQDNTNELLRQLPITLLTPQFERSSKAQGLQHAIHQLSTFNSQLSTFNYIVVLDADNVVLPDFLEQLNAVCQKGYQAIQCHRCAKNSDNDIAVLDGGLSSALIGSGMCFTFEWFKRNVNLLNSAVEDRELESLLLQEKVFIKFEENIHVFDEKVNNHENFERQRLRWLNGQLQTLLIMLPNIPHAITTGNINYIDKTIQQALIPRSILLVMIPLFSLIMLCVAPVWSLKWWILFLVLCLSLYISIPSQMRNSTVFGKLSSFPALALKRITRSSFILLMTNKHSSC